MLNARGGSSSTTLGGGVPSMPFTKLINFKLSLRNLSND